MARSWQSVSGAFCQWRAGAVKRFRPATAQVSEVQHRKMGRAEPDPARLEIGRLYARFNSAPSDGAVWLRQKNPWLRSYLQQYSGGGGI